MRVLGVSAGNGVNLFPFRDNLIGNIEMRGDYLIDKKPFQWNINFPGIPWYRSLDGCSEKKVDVIIGNPKCGNSSVFALSRGKKFTTSSEEPSLTLFFQAVNKFNPEVFVLENLEKLLSVLNYRDIQDATQNKYQIYTFSGSVSNYGNSQVSRKRLVVVGFKKFPDLASPSYPKDGLLTTGELLSHLPKNGHIKEDLDDIITLYAGFKISLRDMKEFWLSNPHLRHYPIKGGTMNTAPGVYINRVNDFPLTVRKTNRQFNSWGEQMSPRELARIQGIPDDFKILDDGFPEKTLINKGRLTVANTPPYEIGLWIKRILKDSYFTS